MRYIKTYEELTYKNIIIEPFKPEYANEVSKIVIDSVLSNQKNNFSKEMIDIYLSHYSPKSILDRSHKSYMVVVKDGDDIVGTGSIDDDNCIAGIYIKPNNQGKGYGKILINFLIDRIKENGFKVAKLLATPTSKSFYKSLGFIETNNQPYIQGDEMSVHFEMEKNIL